MNKIDISKWEEFEIGKLFQKIKCNKLPYKVTALEKFPMPEADLPALTAGVENQGLSCYVPRENATILKNCISVSANGANSGVMFYQPKEFTVLQDSYAIKYIGDELNEYAYLFLISTLRNTIWANFDWKEKATWDKVSKRTVKLPIVKKGKPDWEYMENHMKNIEAETIKKLAALNRI